MGKKLLRPLADLGTVALLLFLLSPSSRAAELKKLNLDSAGALGTTIRSDTRIRSEGSGSIRISTLWPTTISVGEVSGLDVEHAVLVYRGKVRSENLEGQAFLEMWCYVGGGQYFSRGLNSFVSGSSDWKTLETPFFLQAGQKAEKVILNVIINGRGTIWIDDVTLSAEPLN
ncbi:MAG: hypothetical protein GTN81_00280 [Proteobacteria bacterium]|nr:hypothetical protein [Pseudomonadota bacterium]